MRGLALQTRELSCLGDAQPVVVTQTTGDKRDNRYVSGVESPVFETESCAARREGAEARPVTQYLEHKSNIGVRCEQKEQTYS